MTNTQIKMTSLHLLLVNLFIQALQHEKTQIQKQLNIQIHNFTTLQLQYNENMKVININNAKYNALLSQFQQTNLIKSKHEKRRSNKTSKSIYTDTTKI